MNTWETRAIAVSFVLLAGCSEDGTTAQPAIDAASEGGAPDAFSGTGGSGGASTDSGVADISTAGDTGNTGMTSDAADAAKSSDAAEAGAAEAGDAAEAGAVAEAGDAAEASDAAEAGNVAEAGPPTLTGLLVSTGALRPAFSSDVTDYDVTSLNRLYPIQVTATATDPAATLTVHGASAQSGTPASFTLTTGENIEIVVQSGAASKTYTVHYIPKKFPPFTATTTASAGTEDVLLSSVSLGGSSEPYLIMIDRSAAPLYYRTIPQKEVQDFQQAKLPSGAIAYTFTGGTFDPRGWTLGTNYIMDQKFNDVSQVQLLANKGHGVLPVDGHDFLLLDTNHYVAMAYVQRTVDLSKVYLGWNTQAQVMNGVVQEVKDGTVLVEWDSADFPSLYVDSTDGNPFTTTNAADYLHFNSMDIDPTDGNFVFSFRHTDSIIKVNRTTAKIIWTLGGKEDMFGLTAGQLFSHQHHAKVQPDGSITVFDNGNNLHQSRAISFVLNETTHQVSSFQVLYAKPAGQPQSTFMGSVVPLGPTRGFYGWGGWFTTQLAPVATEVVDGTVAWTLQTTAPQTFSYRSLPISAR